MNAHYKMILMLVTLAVLCFTTISSTPDSAGHPPEGFAYGGIPYGSMSGNIAEYYRMKQRIPHYVAQPVVHYPNYYPTYH